MSLDIVVKRANAFPYKHENVSGPLLGSSLPAALALGESILDEEGTGSQIVDYEIDYRPGLLCGQMVEIKDSLVKRVVRGKIVSVSHTVTRSSDSEPVTVFSKIKVEIPTEFYTLSV